MTITPTPFAPAISVAIPMYNAEKYIGACLESILGQTFQDFEVIVVDDCSADNSCKIVESYIPKFGGRLKLYQTKKNSGGPGEPSNIGVNLSRGKYIYIIDNDDLIVNNALEFLYNYAEKFNADVVNMVRTYVFFSDNEKPFPKNENIKIINWTSFNSEKPMLEPDNIGVRVKNICMGLMGRTAWQKFTLRDLLLENSITFPEKVRIAMDTVWALQVFCCAKKIVTIPDALYIYREVSNSTSHTKRTPEENIPNTMPAMLMILNFMNNFFDNQKFFLENPQYQYALLNYLERACFGDLLYQTPKIPAGYKFYEILKPECEKIFGEYGKVLAYLCTASNFSRSRLEMLNRRNIEMENKLKQLQGG